MPRHIVIGLAGYKGSGKNTVANIIEKFVGKDQVHQYAFAGPVREACAAVFGDGELCGEGGIWWNDAQKEQPQTFLGGHSPRYYMRQIAQAIRGEDPDFWARATQRRVSQRTTRAEYKLLGHLHFDHPELDDVELHLVTDLRFANEWQHLQWTPCVQAGNVHLVLVDRGGTPDGHPSEDLSWIDTSQCITIHNNGTLAELDAAVKSIVSQLCKPTT